AGMVRSAEAAGVGLPPPFSTHTLNPPTQLSLLAAHQPPPPPPLAGPRLLALFAGACAAAGANISGAHISTTRDGFALDTFLLAREFDLDEDETRRAGRIAEPIERVLKGEIRLG